MSVEITHVRYASTNKTHETISDFKWRNEQDNSTGQSTKAATVEFIDGGGKAYVGSGAAKVQVHTVHPSGRAAYCQTKADGQWSNNLLALPSSRTDGRPLRPERRGRPRLLIARRFRRDEQSATAPASALYHGYDSAQ